MNVIKKGFVVAGFMSILMIAAPTFAETYYGNNGYTNTYYPQQSYTYGNPLIYQVVNVPTYTYAPINMQMYMPSYLSTAMPNQYSYVPPQQYYARQYLPQNQYYGSQYSRPEYDSSYAPYSNYYTTYPQQNNGYTGDRDAFGSPLCNWQGYGRSDCSFNPHQWVYDPYTGTWY